MVARFAKLPNDRSIEHRVGTTYLPPGEEQWRTGDRGVRCFLWLHDRELRRSLKGAGPGVLGIR